MNVHYMAQKAEESGEIIRPELCETCKKRTFLVRHHRDYNKPLEITWLCGSCHRQEHCANKDLKNPDNKNLNRRPIQVDDETHEAIRLEALRQSLSDPNRNSVSMGDVIAQWAEKNKQALPPKERP